MTDSSGLTFLSYLSNCPGAVDTMAEKSVYGILLSLQHQQEVCLPASPIQFIIDYTCGEFLFMSERIREITDYCAEEFMRAGPELFIHITQKNDFAIFNQKIFGTNISLLRSVAPQLRTTLNFSTNFRVISKDGSCKKLLLRSAYIMSDETGLPLYGIGELTDISAFKTDNVITHLIEKTEWMHGACIRKPVASYYYYPDEEDTMLSKQEKNILHWIVEGYSGKQIADKLHLSDLTVHTHRKNMLKKTNSRNVAQLISFALRSRII